MRSIHKNPTFEKVPVRLIKVDPAYQRELKNSHVFRLADNWEGRKAGAIAVSLRPDGFYYAFDGQHRLAAAKERGIEELWCEVWRNLVPSDEAGLFFARNDDLNVRAFDKFRALVEAGDPDRCEIAKIVHDTGWALGDNDQDGQIRAVSALERVYGVSRNSDAERHPDRLRTTLEVIHRAWGYDQDGVAGFLLDGLGKVIGRYGDQLDHEMLIRKLSKYPGGPTALVGRSKELRAFINTTVPNCVAELIVETYNKGLRRTQITGWRS